MEPVGLCDIMFSKFVPGEKPGECILSSGWYERGAGNGATGDIDWACINVKVGEI